jgi:chemotaxis protein histidine kinase CheA
MTAKKKKLKVVSFKDHMVIVPPNGLEDRAVETGDLSAETDALKRAEAALVSLSVEFSEWIITEADRLDETRRAIHGGIRTANLADLFRAAHDIKGGAATFGYPAAAIAAASLCRLLSEARNPLVVPLVLIDQHVDAVRAIIREADHAFAEEIGEALVGELERMTEHYLATEDDLVISRLDRVVSPPTAPETQ